jgi:hypothetical protein
LHIIFLSGLELATARTIPMVTSHLRMQQVLGDSAQARVKLLLCNFVQLKDWRLVVRQLGR